MPEHPQDGRLSSGSSVSHDDPASVLGQMMRAIPAGPDHNDRAVLREAIEATQHAALAAVACADACLGEEMVEELVGCIRTLLDTADVCEATARVLSRNAGPGRVLARILLAACAAACRAGREVCEEFLPIHDHCRICARACRQAERACRALLGSLP